MKFFALKLHKRKETVFLCVYVCPFCIWTHEIQTKEINRTFKIFKASLWEAKWNWSVNEKLKRMITTKWPRDDRITKRQNMWVELETNAQLIKEG